MLTIVALHPLFQAMPRSAGLNSDNMTSPDALGMPNACIPLPVLPIRPVESCGSAGMRDPR